MMGPPPKFYGTRDILIVRVTGKTVAEVAKDRGINAGTLRARVSRDRVARGDKHDPTKGGSDYVRRLERENAELRMERDVLKRSVVLWVKKATR